MLNLSNKYSMDAVKINKNYSFNSFKIISFSIYFRFTIWLLDLTIKQQKRYRSQINSNLYCQNTTRKQKLGQVCFIFFSCGRILPFPLLSNRPKNLKKCRWWDRLQGHLALIQLLSNMSSFQNNFVTPYDFVVSLGP